MLTSYLRAADTSSRLVTVQRNGSAVFKIEREIRADTHIEPSHQSVDNEIAYRWS